MAEDKCDITLTMEDQEQDPNETCNVAEETVFFTPTAMTLPATPAAALSATKTTSHMLAKQKALNEFRFMNSTVEEQAERIDQILQQNRSLQAELEHERSQVAALQLEVQSQKLLIQKLEKQLLLREPVKELQSEQPDVPSCKKRPRSPLRSTSLSQSDELAAKRSKLPRRGIRPSTVPKPFSFVTREENKFRRQRASSSVAKK